MQTDAGGNVNIGRIDNVASTPFIDFNSGATSVDYDVRIQVSGGNGAVGNGLLAITASQVNIDNGTFFVDGANNRVGIGTTSPNQTLTVVGTASITSTLNVGGTINVSGNANIDSGTLYVDSSGFVGIGTTSHIGGKVNIINDVSGSVGFLLRGAAGQSVSTFRIQSSGGTNTVNINGETGGGYFAGNFGIGVLIPTAKLDVDGSALIRSSASVTGNLLVDTNTLFVDATNNEVGVLTTSPASALHVAGGLLVTGSALVNGTITGTSTTKAAGDSSTSLATTAFVSNMIRYNGAFSGSTSSVAGFFVIPVSPGTSLNGCLMMSRGTAARFFNGEVNLGINGAASAGYIRGVATNSAGTAIAVNTSVPCFYIAW